MKTVAYYQFGETTLERRETVCTGHLIKFRTRQRDGKMRLHMFRSRNNSKFGALREFVANCRAWNTIYWFESIQQCSFDRVDYVSA